MVSHYKFTTFGPIVGLRHEGWWCGLPNAASQALVVCTRSRRRVYVFSLRFLRCMLLLAGSLLTIYQGGKLTVLLGL